MAYQLAALLLGPNARDRFQYMYPAFPIIQLAPQVAMAPLTGDGLKQLGSPRLVYQLVGADGEFDWLTEGVMQVLRHLTVDSMAAFVGAEYSGGRGTQWGVVFRNGAPVRGPLVDQRLINHALCALGIVVDQALDEFDMVGLGHYRSTDEWISAAPKW